MANNNGLTSKDEVRDACFSASYLVLGLGDVYLGAPCAVPVDPRHRLVTTKYNPARTFTAEGTVGGGCRAAGVEPGRGRSALPRLGAAAAGCRASAGHSAEMRAEVDALAPSQPAQVGIGGSYMCIYPMNSPGGYQLVGRTLPIWNTFGRAGPFNPEKPWLLEFFDQVRRAAGLQACRASSSLPLLVGDSPSSQPLLIHSGSVCADPRPHEPQPTQPLPLTPPLTAPTQVRFFQVSEDELEAAREGFQTGQYQIRIEEGTFDMAAYTAMLETIKDEVAVMKERQKAAMTVQVRGLAAGCWLLIAGAGCWGWLLGSSGS
jgi:urea carboxylase